MAVHEPFWNGSRKALSWPAHHGESVPCRTCLLGGAVVAAACAASPKPARRGEWRARLLSGSFENENASREPGYTRVSMVPSIETSSLPTRSRHYPCSFTFYLGTPGSSIPAFLH